MSCFHPFLGKYNGDPFFPKYNIQGWYDPSIAELGDIMIPCGHCLGCRLDYSRQWADRMILELDHSKDAVFVTFTYDNEHVPVYEYFDYGEEDAQGIYFPLGIGDRMQYDHVLIPKTLTLDKTDFQSFIKRLRARKEFKDRKIRYYAAGEYGSSTRRPHMHAIIFGLSIKDFPDLKLKGKNELGQNYYISEMLQGIWKKGFTLLTEVSWQTCAYVSRYVMKKAYADDLCFDQTPEFSLMSRRPGIGAYFFDEHPDWYERSSLYLSDSNGSVKVGVPKYFLQKLKSNKYNFADYFKYISLSESRKDYASDIQLLELAQTDLSYVELLEVKENKILDKVEILNKLRK